MSHSSRFAQLRQVIFGHDGPTREEVRYLKILLSDTQTDLIGDLPLELVVLVALELRLSDFARCLCVSKIWRKRFLSSPVISAYAKHRWPALIGGVVNRCNFLGTLSKLGWANYSLRHPVKHNPEFVPWDGTAHYQLDPIFHNQSDNLPDAYTRYRTDPAARSFAAIYASGKVAWHPCGCVVVIDDLTLKMRKVFTPPSGVMHGLGLKLQALGSRLVIGSIDRLLIAWDHINNQAYEKSLPCRILRCTTQDDRVAIVLYGGGVAIWTPGHAVLQLDISPLTLEPSIGPSEAKTWEACLDVLFDPRDSKILYLVSGFCNHIDSSNMVRVTVHEFSVAGHAVASWSSEYYDHAIEYGDIEDAAEPRIVVTEYAFERNCIFFWRRTKRVRNTLVASFDKLERKFLRDADYLFPPALQSFNRYYPQTHGGVDLDFGVDFFSTGYEVVRSMLLGKPSPDSILSKTN
ncbi:hypothetical protein F4823DRAFT_310092 [Ustulina deusta]|nr:hypothetical protein F4823DRAFT_310092 [Ustulina deusta]